MKFKIALCALLLTFISTTASPDSYTAEDGWTGWGEWDCENWGWDRENTYQKGSCDKKEPDTKPSPVPSPTAALAGLAVMGVMLGRRRNRRA